MSVIQNNLLMTPEGYQISRSVRTRKSNTGYFSRTPSSATNRKTWTWSGWIKFGDVSGSIQSIFGTMTTSNYTIIGINSAGQGSASLTFESVTGTTTIIGRGWTNAVYRDPSAWYHVVFAIDTTQAVSTDRVKIYVNGVLQSLNSYTAPTQNSDHYVNQASVSHALMCGYSTSYTTDGYLTEVNFIDGQALTPSSFGETDAVTGVWKPKKYAGTYGTNGFYLNFSDNSNNTAATIGKDSSGNGNNWTPNNIVLVDGATYDSMIDVPTMYADGGNGRGNYAVINPLSGNQTFTCANGNLTWSVGAVNSARCASFGTNSLKIYFEVTGMPTSQWSAASVVAMEAFSDNASGTATNELAVVQDASGVLFTRSAGVSTTLSTSATASDIIQFAFDAATGKVWIGKNNTWFASGNPSAGTNPYTTLAAGLTYTASVGRVSNNATTASGSINFGQRPFAYTPPTGFKALNTQNLPDATIKKGNAYFDATTYTGTGATLSVTNSGLMQPDFVWIKDRSAARSHRLFDAVRGATKALFSDATDAETTLATDLTAFNSNGFTLGAGAGSNSSGETFVGWQWKESVSAGFDIVTYTGTGVARTVSHSLGVTPSMIIIKARSTTSNWPVWHASIPSNQLYLNLTNAVDTPDISSVNSSTFTLNTAGLVNGNTFTYVAYLFAEVAGYSKFGSYTGNGSTDGAFVYTGFRPRFILIKSSSAVQSWHLIDTARDTYNLAGQGLDANTSAAEYTPASSGYPIDILSNGFKHRYSSEPNVSGATYIYAAFAENPFKNSLAR